MLDAGVEQQTFACQTLICFFAFAAHDVELTPIAAGIVRLLSVTLSVVWLDEPVTM